MFNLYSGVRGQKFRGKQGLSAGERFEIRARLYTSIGVLEFGVAWNSGLGFDV